MRCFLKRVSYGNVAQFIPVAGHFQQDGGKTVREAPNVVDIRESVPCWVVKRW